MGTKIELSFVEQYKILLERENKTVADVAALIGTTRQNLNQKLNRNNLSEKDMEQLAAAIGYDLQIIMNKRWFDSSFLLSERGIKWTN